MLLPDVERAELKHLSGLLADNASGKPHPIEGGDTMTRDNWNDIKVPISCPFHMSHVCHMSVTLVDEGRQHGGRGVSILWREND